MKTVSVPPILAAYLTLRDHQLFRYNLLPTIEACWVALIVEHEHTGTTFESLDSLVRQVVDFNGLRPSRSHWLATSSFTDEEIDVSQVHEASLIEFVPGGLSWVSEDNLRASLCPPDCSVAIRAGVHAPGVLAAVPRL